MARFLSLSTPPSGGKCTAMAAAETQVTHQRDMFLAKVSQGHAKTAEKRFYDLAISG